MNARLVTVSEAAERLGVVPQRVRALVQTGELDAVRTQGGWLIDPNALARRVLLGELGVISASMRPWSHSVAWAAMRAVDGDVALLSRLDRKTRYRLRRRLRAAEPAYLLSAVRNRARLIRASVHPSRVDRLSELVVPSGIAGAGIHGLGLTGSGGVDGYLSVSVVTGARDALRVRDAETGAHLLRVVDDERVLEGLRVAPRLAVAADLLDYAVEDGVFDGRVVSTLKTLLTQIAPVVRLASSSIRPTNTSSRADA